MTTICIAGAGSHGRALAEIARVRSHSVAWYDDKWAEGGSGLPVERITEHDAWIVGVHNPQARAELAARIPGRATRLVHPSVVRGNGCVRHFGSVLAAGVILTCDVIVGRHTHLNVGVTVSQSTFLGDFVTISPGAHIAGECIIGDRTFIGVGASIANLVSIGSDVTIGAGCVVLHDVPAGSTVVGVPARPLERSHA